MSGPRPPFGLAAAADESGVGEDEESEDTGAEDVDSIGARIPVVIDLVFVL